MGAIEHSIVILSAVRTPFGGFCGALKDLSATELGVLAARAALARSHVGAANIDHVIFGNAQQTSPDAIYLARHIGLKVGLPPPVPALTVNRICGSGLQSVISGAQLLLLGEAECVLAGGTENMSQAPHVIRGARFGIALGEGKLEDSLWSALTDTHCHFNMAETAENLAAKYAITREETDQYAYQSQMRTRAAQESGRLKDEIEPIAGILQRDEHPRPATTREVLASLKPVFRKDGVVTAGNASGIADGAAAVVLTTAANAHERGLRPLARISAWGVAGCDPTIMGIGPVPAIKMTLEHAGLTLDQIDLIEVNEAFACQYLAVEKELGLNRERVNVNGGAIAIGHPLGATGTRLATTLIYELKRRHGRYGLASACIGGGQGIALLLENFE
jgi:acetyl-CoA acetyltransferase family protein